MQPPLQLKFLLIYMKEKITAVAVIGLVCKY